MRQKKLRPLQTQERDRPTDALRRTRMRTASSTDGESRRETAFSSRLSASPWYGSSQTDCRSAPIVGPFASKANVRRLSGGAISLTRTALYLMQIHFCEQRSLHAGGKPFRLSVLRHLVEVPALSADPTHLADPPFMDIACEHRVKTVPL